MSWISRRQPNVEESIRFHNRAESLTGILYRPLGTGPFPAVAFVAGSGPSARDGYSSLPPIWDVFARYGIASFAWDKPGVGESSGDWRSQTNEDRAREVVAAIAQLRQHPAIDGDKVGVWGISQAGWVIPLVCSMDPCVDFVIAVSIPVGTGAQQELYRVAHCLPADGYSAGETQKAVNFTSKRLTLMEQGVPYERIVELQRDVEGESWFGEVGKLDEENYRFLQANAFVSPQPLLSSIRCPMLGIFGERDTIINVPESVQVLERVLHDAGNRDKTIRVLPGVDHVIFKSVTGGMRELDRSFFQTPIKPYPPEYMELMGRWIRKCTSSRSDRHAQ